MLAFLSNKEFLFYGITRAVLKRLIFVIFAVVSFSRSSFACEGCDALSDTLLPVKLNLDKIKMQVIQTDENIVFKFSQVNRAISAEYSGGKIRSGFLIGKFLSENQITFNYCQKHKDGSVVAGISRCDVFKNEEGKIILIEHPQRRSCLGESEMNIFRQI